MRRKGKNEAVPIVGCTVLKPKLVVLAYPLIGRLRYWLHKIG
jgi:hypothetical protein